ncbi:MAG: DUF6719 family protein [Candidatus Electrothrix sp. YB6]
MKCSLLNAVVIFSSMLFLAGCQQDSQKKVLKAMPANYTLSYNHIVYVENDGRCDTGQVIKVTGGKKSRGIKRKYECVNRPQ